MLELAPLRHAQDLLECLHVPHRIIDRIVVMGCPSKPLPALCVAPVPVGTGPEVTDAAARVPEWIVHSSPIEHAGYPLPVVGRVVAHKDRPAAAEVLPEPGRETLSNFRAPAQLGWATRCASCSPPGCPAPPRPCGSGRRRRWAARGRVPSRGTASYGRQVTCRGVAMNLGFTVVPVTACVGPVGLPRRPLAARHLRGSLRLRGGRCRQSCQPAR